MSIWSSARAQHQEEDTAWCDLAPVPGRPPKCLRKDNTSWVSPLLSSFRSSPQTSAMSLVSFPAPTLLLRQKQSYSPLAQRHLLPSPAPGPINPPGHVPYRLRSHLEQRPTGGLAAPTCPDPGHLRPAYPVPQPSSGVSQSRAGTAKPQRPSRQSARPPTYSGDHLKSSLGSLPVSGHLGCTPVPLRHLPLSAQLGLDQMGPQSFV